MAEEGLDYERMLRLYLAQVIACESVDLIDRFEIGFRPSLRERLTDRELQRLRELSAEAAEMI